MGQFLALSEPGLDKIMHEDEQPIETQYTKFFNVGSLDQLNKDVAKMGGFGNLVEIPEGGAITYDEAISPVSKRFTYVDRGLGYKITRKFWLNDLYKEVEDFERDLRRAVDDDIELYAFDLLNNATVTTNNTGFDGLALASTAHTRLDGGAVQANRPTTLGALSVATLTDAIIAFKKYRNDRGRPYRSTPRDLITTIDLEPAVAELLQSSLRPDTANNATNALTRYGLRPSSSLYITGSTFWALVGDKHDMNVLFRYRPKTQSKIDFETNNIHRKVEYGISRGFAEWRGTWFGNT
jgi:hypothetical protein